MLRMLILNVAKRGSMSRATWYDVPVGFLLQYFFQVLQFFDLMATVRPIFYLRLDVRAAVLSF
jgi:hypothetical protein